MNTGTEDDWRRHGEARRKTLLLKDEMEGGTTFHINGRCRIQCYFEVSERVLKHFASMYTSRRKPEDIYVMGNRYIVFLTKALPAHPEYNSKSKEVSDLRKRGLRLLDWMKQRLDVVAQRIDEEQLNLFILQDLPADIKVTKITDAVAEVSLEEDEETNQEQEWESFSGWSLDIQEETKEKTEKWKRQWKDIMEVSYDSNEMELSPSSSVNDAIFELDSMEERLYYESMEPSLPAYSFMSEDEEQQENAELDTSFLKAVACADFYSETDSEAVDSWAQGGDSEVQSGSSVHVRYDAARIAFQEIMNKVPLASNNGQEPKHSQNTVPETSQSAAVPPLASETNDTDKNRGVVTDGYSPGTYTTGAWDMNSGVPKTDPDQVLGIRRFSPGPEENVNSSHFDPATIETNAIIQQEWVSFDIDEKQEGSEVSWATHENQSESAAWMSASTSDEPNAVNSGMQSTIRRAHMLAGI